MTALRHKAVIRYLWIWHPNANIALARQQPIVTMAATACCFCGRTVDQVTHLIEGPDLFICDICVDACVDTLATKDHGWGER
jgi:hypothetical protein